MKQPRLIVVSAPSGAGKTTLCSKLLADFPAELVLSISTTTRAPRGKEKDGVDYHFTARAEFDRQVAAGRFAEWAEVHGNRYGTSKDTIEKAFAQGKSVLLDIDVQGAASLRKTYPNEAYSVFVAPPSMDALEARLKARGTDGTDTIAQRLRNARAEMARSVEFDTVIVNDTLEHAYAELKAAVTHALMHPRGGARG